MGGKGGGGNTSSGTSTTTTSPDPQAMQAYRDVLNRAQTVGNLPYTPYTGELVPGINPQQSLGIGQINQYAQSAQPTMNYAVNAAEMAAAPVTQNAINYYQNPFTQQVVGATAAQFANQNMQQLQATRGNEIAQGAMGGSRAAVAESELANQQNLAQAPVIAGLESQGYLTGLNTALTEQQNLANAAYSLGNLGVAQQGAGLSGANATIGAGTLQSQTQQAQDIAAYQQFLNQQAFPYQQTGWLAGIDTGVGSNMGGTSTSNFSMTGPSPSAKGQIGGGAMSALGMLGKKGMNRGGRVNGMYRGGGVMGGDRQHLQGGGIAGPGASIGGWPYATAQGYIPNVPLTHGPGPPQAHAPTPNMPSRPPGGQMPKIGDGAGGKRRAAGTNQQGQPDTGGGGGENQPLVGPDQKMPFNWQQGQGVGDPNIPQNTPEEMGISGAGSSADTGPVPPQPPGASGIPLGAPSTTEPGFFKPGSAERSVSQPGSRDIGVQGSQPSSVLPESVDPLTKSPLQTNLQPGQGPVGQQFAQATQFDINPIDEGWKRDPNTNLGQVSGPAAPAAPASPIPSSDALNFQVPGASDLPGMFGGMGGDQFPDMGGGLMGGDIFGGMGGFDPIDAGGIGDLGGGGGDIAAMDMPDMSMKGADGGRINAYQGGGILGYQGGGSPMAASLPGGMSASTDPGGMSPVEPRFSNPLGDYIYGPDFGTAVLPSDRDMSSAVGERRGGGVLGYQEGGDVEGDGWDDGSGDLPLLRIADRPDNTSFLRGAQIMTPAQTRAQNPLGPVNTLSWAANNPGAVGNVPRTMSPAALGQVGTIQRLPGTSGPAKMAVFGDPVMGGAAGVGVLANTYGGKTLGQALGPRGYGETPSDIRSVLGRSGGLSPDTVISPEFLQSEAGQRFLPQQWRMEGGGQNLMTPSQVRDATTFGLTNIPRDPDVPGGGRDMGAVYGPSQAPSSQGFADTSQLPSESPDWSQSFSDPNVSPGDMPSAPDEDVPVGSNDGSFDVADIGGDMGDFRRGGMVRGYDDGGDVADDGSDVLPVSTGVVPLPRSRPQIDNGASEPFTGYGMAPPAPPDYSDWDREAGLYSKDMPWEDKVTGLGAGLGWPAHGLTQERPELLPKLLPHSDRLGPPLAESDYPKADKSFRTLTPPSYDTIPWSEAVRRFGLGTTNDRMIRAVPNVDRMNTTAPLPYIVPRGSKPNIRSILRSRDVLDQFSGPVHARGGGVRGYDDGGAPDDDDASSIADVGDVGGGVGGGDDRQAEVHWSDQVEHPDLPATPGLMELTKSADPTDPTMAALLTDRQNQQDRANAAVAQQAFSNYPEHSSDETADVVPDTAGPPASLPGATLPPVDDSGVSAAPLSSPFMTNAPPPPPPVGQPLHVGAQPFWAGLGQANVGRDQYQTGPENAPLMRPDQWPAFVNSDPVLANATRQARPDYYNNRFFTRVRQSEADPLAYAARDVVERQLDNSEAATGVAGKRSSFTQGLTNFADWLANRGRTSAPAPPATPETADLATGASLGAGPGSADWNAALGLTEPSVPRESTSRSISVRPATPETSAPVVPVKTEPPAAGQADVATGPLESGPGTPGWNTRLGLTNTGQVPGSFGVPGPSGASDRATDKLTGPGTPEWAEALGVTPIGPERWISVPLAPASKEFSTNTGQFGSATGTFPGWDKGLRVDENGVAWKTTSPRRAANVADYVTGGNQSSGVPGDILNQARQVAMSGGPAAVRAFMQREGFPQSGPWCGEFAASVVRAAGYSPPSNPETASNWRTFGTAVPWSDVRPGDIAVRKSSWVTGGYTPTGGQGSHVTFVDGINPNTGQFYGLGGNQGGRQGVTRIPFNPADFDFRRFGSTMTPQPRDAGATSGTAGGQRDGFAINRGQFGPATGIYPGSSPWNVGQAGSAGPVGATREAATTSSAPTENSYLSRQRAPILAELNSNPGLLARLASIGESENSGRPLGILESLVNRAAKSGQSLASLVNSSFWGGRTIRRMNADLAQGVPQDYIDRARDALNRIGAGSNVTRLSTDQGGVNEIKGNKWSYGGEYYGDMDADASWRRRQEAAMRQAGLMQSGGAVPASDDGDASMNTDDDDGAPFDVADVGATTGWMQPTSRGATGVAGDAGIVDDTGQYSPSYGGVAGRRQNLSSIVSPDTRVVNYDRNGNMIDTGYTAGDYGDRGRGRSGWDFSSGSKIWPAMVTAGAAMMASGSPFFGQALGEGLLAGASAYSNASAAERTYDVEQQKLDMEAKKIFQNQQNEQRKMDLEEQKYRNPIASPYQKWEMNKPMPGFMIDPDKPGGWKAIPGGPMDPTSPAYKSQNKPPPFWEYDPDKPGTLRPIPGGQADPTSENYKAAHVPVGWQRRPDGTIEPIPKYQKPLSEQEQEAQQTKIENGELSQKTVDTAKKIAMDPTELKRAGSMYNIIGGSYLTGLGRDKDTQNAIRSEAARQDDANGITPEQRAQLQAEYQGSKAGQRTLSQMEARMGSAGFEAQGAIALGRKAIENVPRTSFLPLNQLIQGAQRATLNPDQTELAVRAQGIVNTYAAVMARGASVTTDSARSHAEALLNTAGSAATWNRALDTMESEINMAIHSPDQMRKFYMDKYGKGSVGAADPDVSGTAKATPATPATPAKPATTATPAPPKSVTQGGFVYELQPDGKYKAVRKAP